MTTSIAYEVEFFESESDAVQRELSKLVRDRLPVAEITAPQRLPSESESGLRWSIPGGEHAVVITISVTLVSTLGSVIKEWLRAKRAHVKLTDRHTGHSLVFEGPLNDATLAAIDRFFATSAQLPPGNSD